MRSAKTFGMLPTWLSKSPAVTSLTHGAFRVLFAMASQYRGPGTNNGALVLTVSAMQEYGIVSSSTVWDAERQLRSHGLIALAKRGGRKRPNRYALTWLPVDKCKEVHDLPITGKPLDTWKHYHGPLGPHADAGEPAIIGLPD